MDEGIKRHFYKILKYSFLILYGFFIYQCELLNFESRLKMHLILVPIFKLFNFYVGNNKRPFSQVLFSIITDNIMAFIHLRFVLVYLVGNYFCLNMAFSVSFIALQESIEFYFFPEGTYLIKIRKQIEDFFLLPSAVLLFYYASTSIDFEYEPTPFTFTSLIIWMLSADFFFGIGHFLTHRVEYLWKNYHKVHHEYKLENINSFANFYANPLDSFMMLSTLILPLLCFQYVFGIKIVYFMCIDGFHAAVHTHNKYANNHITSHFFFEYDLIDQTIGKYFDSRQMSEWHLKHHQKVSKNYTLYGSVGESVVKYFGEIIISIFNLSKELKIDTDIDIDEQKEE